SRSWRRSAPGACAACRSLWPKRILPLGGRPFPGDDPRLLVRCGLPAGHRHGATKHLVGLGARAGMPAGCGQTCEAFVDRVRNEDVDCLEGMSSDFTGRKQAAREYEIRDIDRPEFGHPSTDSGDGGSAMVSSWWTPVLGGLPPPRQGSGFWSSESKVTGDVLGTRQASSVGSVRIAS